MEMTKAIGHYSAVNIMLSTLTDQNGPFLDIFNSRTKDDVQSVEAVRHGWGLHMIADCVMVSTF